MPCTWDPMPSERSVSQPYLKWRCCKRRHDVRRRVSRRMKPAVFIFSRLICRYFFNLSGIGVLVTNSLQSCVHYSSSANISSENLYITYKCVIHRKEVDWLITRYCLVEDLNERSSITVYIVAKKHVFNISGNLEYVFLWYW